VSTTLTGRWRLNVTGNAVTDRDMHQKRTAATELQELQITGRKYKVSSGNKKYKCIDDKYNTF
jgi:hypothetical protein